MARARDPLARLRAELARARDADISFEAAWRSAYWAAVGEARHGEQRHDWQVALADTRRAWMSAYDREPGPSLNRNLFPLD